MSMFAEAALDVEVLEREYTIEDLFGNAGSADACSAMAAAVGTGAALVLPGGRILIEQPGTVMPPEAAAAGSAPGEVVPVVGETGQIWLVKPLMAGISVAGRAVVGPLSSDPASIQRGKGALCLAQFAIESLYRARITSDIHSRTIQISFDDLSAEHARTVTSEKKYRELSETLEQRVDERTSELERAHASLLEGEKLASVGFLAAGVAHEINNPVGFVMSNLRTLGRWIEKGRLNTDEIQSLTTDCVDGLQRVKEIVADLRSFSHVPEDHKAESVDVTEAVELCLRLVGPEVKMQMLDIRMTSCPVFARVRPDTFNHALLAIVRNAVHASPSAGVIEIDVRANGTFVEVDVRDHGHGVDEAARTHLFEPFFTTREVGSGMGLGLATARQALRRDGGDVRYKPADTGGSIFTVVLMGDRS